MYLRAAFGRQHFNFFSGAKKENRNFSFPYKAAGLNERQAAAHLISRFTFGAKPGDVDAAIKNGWDTHFNQGAETGVFARNVAELSNSIIAFWTDM